MVAVKAAAVDRFVDDPPSNALIVLVYGPDSGLADERAREWAELEPTTVRFEELDT